MSRSEASLALVALALSACQRGDSGTQRVPPAYAGEPADIAILSESWRPRWDDPLPPTSTIFDGQRIRLVLGKGEVAGFGVYLRASVTARLELPADLQHERYRVGWARVRSPSTSVYGPSRGPGEYADELIQSAGANVRAPAWFFDVHGGAEVGIRRGQLDLGDRTIPIEVEIRDPFLELGRAPMVWAFFRPDEVRRAEVEDLTGAYHRLFAAHGVVLAGDMTDDDWREQARALGTFRYWPVSVPARPYGAFTASAARWGQRAAAAGATAFAIPVDEPRGVVAKVRARAYGILADTAGVSGDHFAVGVTDAPDPIYGHNIDLYISPQAFPAPPEEGSTRWTYNGVPPQAGSMVVDAPDSALRTWGWIAFRYDVPVWHVWDGLYFRDRYNAGAAGPHPGSELDLNALPLSDPQTDAITFDERGRGGVDYGNGDGWLAYPGVHPSLRLKTLRRGLYDRLLLKALAACDRGKAESLVREAVPRALGEATVRSRWPSEPDGFDRYRDRAWEMLEGCRAR